MKLQKIIGQEVDDKRQVYWQGSWAETLDLAYDTDERAAVHLLRALRTGRKRLIRARIADALWELGQDPRDYNPDLAHLESVYLLHLEAEYLLGELGFDNNLL